MDKINWSGDLVVNIQPLDEQHKNILSHFNDILDRVNTKQSTGVTAEEIGEFISLVLEHFKKEEELMEKYDYPEFAEHKSSHEVARNLLLDVHDKTVKGKKFFPLLNAIVHNCAEDDIKIVDRKFAEYLNKKGITL